MKANKADKKPDISAVIDREESPSTMEPLSIPRNSIHQNHLMDLALELVEKSAGFRCSLPSAIQTSLATIVRSIFNMGARRS